MKQCSHCSSTYESTEMRCPSCASTSAKNLCTSCGTVHTGKLCPSCAAKSAKNQCTSCGTVHTGKLCPDCDVNNHEEVMHCAKCGNKTKDRICSRCGYDVATTNSIKESVTSVVSKATCTLMGHKWLGCKCTTCGEVRDEEHEYQLIKGECLKKCTVCAKTEKSFHQWENNKCIHCGTSKGIINTFWELVNKGLPFLNLEKSSNRALVGLIGLLILLFLFLGIGGLIESFGKKKVPNSASSYEKMNYKDVTNELESAGFTSIETEVLDDLVTGWLTKDGSVEQISINGSTNFSSGKYFPTDADIIITYHTFPEKEKE